MVDGRNIEYWIPNQAWSPYSMMVYEIEKESGEKFERIEFCN